MISLSPTYAKPNVSSAFNISSTLARGARVKRSAIDSGVMGMPGLGQVLATTILLETGPIERFASIGNFASYARCVGSVRTSNGKKKGESNTDMQSKRIACNASQPGIGTGKPVATGL